MSFFSRLKLMWNDWWVSRVLYPRVCGCPVPRLVEFYRAHIQRRHLDVGVGSGYWLGEALGTENWADFEFVCMEAHPERLATARKRLQGRRVDAFPSAIAEGVPPGQGIFDSVAVVDFLHRQPGALGNKVEALLEQVLPHLHPNGVLFGITILGENIEIPWYARFFYWHWNKKGNWDNARDSLGGVMEALSHHFKTFRVEVCGSVVLFSGKGVKLDES